MTADELSARLADGTAPAILDVRSRREYAAGHLPGARHLPFWLAWTRAASLPLSPAAPLVVYCGHGPRAQIAAAALRAHGFSDVALLDGHMSSWQQRGLPLRTGDTP